MASGGGQPLQAPPLRAPAPPAPAPPGPVSRPPHPGRRPASPADRTVVLDAAPGATAELPALPGARPVDVTTPPGLPVLAEPDAGAAPGGPPRGPGSGPAGPPPPPAGAAPEAGAGGPRLGFPTALRRGSGWRDSPAVLAGVVLVVTAVLWFVVATFINRSGPAPTVAAVSGAAPGVRPVEPSTIKAGATSVQEPDGGVTYGPRNTLDNRPTTAWNSRGNGVGATLTYTFAEPLRLRSISVLNGYHKLNAGGDDLWRLNERLRQVRVETEAGQYVWNLKDTKQRQRLDRDLGTTGYVRLVVLSTYPSGKWRDVGLSEIAFAASD